jgi:uncharacterized protein
MRRHQGGSPMRGNSPYADRLITVFDHWYPSPRTRIPLFEEIMQLILGGASGAEMVGLSPVRVVVIETDGSIEQVDNLKAAYQGAAATGLHVTRDPLDAALLLPGVVARQFGGEGTINSVPSMLDPPGLWRRPLFTPLP